MPPEGIDALGQTAPVVIVVSIFLGYMQKARSSQDKIEDRRIDELKRIGQACHTHHEEMMKQMSSALFLTTEALDRNARALGECVGALRRLNGKVG